MISRKKVACWLAAFALVATFGLAACAPQTSEAPSEGAEGGSDTLVAESFGLKDFQQIDAGDFTDTDGQNAKYMNDGNRGCNACHEDLYEVLKGDVSVIQHVMISEPGYDKVYKWTDCVTCHGTNMALCGPNLAPRVHMIHYTNPAFTDVQNGNCWSCHETNQAGELVMWDDFKYTAEMHGYLDPTSEENIGWLTGRGRHNATTVDVVLDSELKLDVEVSQPVGDEAEMYVAHNYSIPEISEEGWALEVTGVNNPRTFTLEELKALPQTERVITQTCATNASNNVLLGNIPITGVTISDLIDACGGLVEGNDAIRTASRDGWGHNFRLGMLFEEDAMIALQYWGHDLTVDQGFPATLVVPNQAGAFWDKWLDSIEFNADPDKLIHLEMWNAAPMMPEMSQGALCTGWLTPSVDGTEAKVGEAVAINGYAYCCATQGHKVAQIAFSADYGKTWKTFDVPESFDGSQWIYFDGSWTPQAAGTYVLKVKAIDAGGFEQFTEANVIVKVTE